MATGGYLADVKRPWRGDHLRAFSAEVKNEWRCTSINPNAVVSNEIKIYIYIYLMCLVENKVCVCLTQVARSSQYLVCLQL